MRSNRLLRAIPLAFALLGLSAAASAQDLEPITVADLDASGAAVYYSLRDNAAVPDSLEDTDAWDIGFEGTTIYVNGAARLVDTPFDDVATAPEDGYREDDAATGTAIPSGSGAGWYVYDMDNHVLSPVPDRTIVVRTPAGTYAKVEILSYYKGGETGYGDLRFYTFRYVHQPDGSRELK